jgi:hypothetical protein
LFEICGGQVARPIASTGFLFDAAVAPAHTAIIAKVRLSARGVLVAPLAPLRQVEEPDAVAAIRTRLLEDHWQEFNEARLELIKQMRADVGPAEDEKRPAPSQSVGRVRPLNSSSGAAPRESSSRAMVVSRTSLAPRSIREIPLSLSPAASPS